MQSTVDAPNPWSTALLQIADIYVNEFQDNMEIFMRTGSSDLAAAENNFKNALSNLNSATGDKMLDMAKAISANASGSVDAFSNSIVKGIRDVKNEVNLSHLAKTKPWSFLLGALISGALFEYGSTRMASPRLLQDDSQDFETNA